MDCWIGIECFDSDLKLWSFRNFAGFKELSALASLDHVGYLPRPPVLEYRIIRQGILKRNTNYHDINDSNNRLYNV